MKFFAVCVNADCQIDFSQTRISQTSLLMCNTKDLLSLALASGEIVVKCINKLNYVGKIFLFYCPPISLIASRLC